MELTRRGIGFVLGLVPARATPRCGGGGRGSAGDHQATGTAVDALFICLCGFEATSGSGCWPWRIEKRLK